MGHAATRPCRLTWSAALRLGRVSNLPTVWTNALAGVVLAGGDRAGAAFAVLLLGLSLLYVAGMYLNDWFDAGIDAREQPSRPIPSGAAEAGMVLAAGLALLGTGWLLVASLGGCAALSGLALAGAILLYDAWHKGNPAGPFIMGLCRGLVYVTAALALTGTVTPPVLVGAGLLLGYIVGVSIAAKREASWPVGLLIAGASVLDATVVAVAGAPELIVPCLAAFALTLVLQRHIPGT
ncbi:MAG TPA: UbiA family prenyltransferase [Azospirillaceae bacterium]|nr:UbiA family prenyltransferase [Azospirillaceae bacterium]